MIFFNQCINTLSNFAMRSVAKEIINYHPFFKVALTGLSFLPTSTSGSQPQELVIASELNKKKNIVAEWFIACW